MLAADIIFFKIIFFQKQVMNLPFSQFETISRITFFNGAPAHLRRAYTFFKKHFSLELGSMTGVRVCTGTCLSCTSDI